METIKKIWANIWMVVAGVFAILTGMFFWERGKKEDAEAKLGNAETSGKSDVLDAKIQSNQEKLDELVKANQEAKEDTNNDTKENLVDFFKKR